MLAIETIREQESNNKWEKLTHIVVKRDKKKQDQYNSELSNKLYKRITLDIFHIEKIEEVLNSDAIQYFPDKKKELVLEKDELRIKASFNFIGYLVSQEGLEIERKTENFLLGIECISTTLIHSGETLYSLDKNTIILLIKNLHTALGIWKKIRHKIEAESETKSVWLVHEKSLKSIYSSLYILEDTYRDLVNEKDREQKVEQNDSWIEEEKYYDNLLEDMEEWAKEEWTEEEQQAFKRAMSNLS